MPSTALKPQAQTIPPDLAAVLGGASIHPELLRTPIRPVAPSVATLTSMALALAGYAARQLGEFGSAESAGFAGAAFDGAGPGAGFLREVVLHSVGSGGVLHLAASSRPRAVSPALGTLAQRCTSRPVLRPGTVRLLPPGHSVTLADLDGNGALAVEVVY